MQHVSEPIRQMYEAKQPISWESANVPVNSYERHLITPLLDDVGYVKYVQSLLKNGCISEFDVEGFLTNLPVTYEENILRVCIHELLRRFESTLKIEEPKQT